MPRRFAFIAALALIAVFTFFLNVQFLLPALAQTTNYSVFRTSYPGFNFRSTNSAYSSMFSTIRFGASGPFIGLTGGGGNGKVAILASKGAALGTPGLFIQSIDPNSNSLLSAISLYPPSASAPGQVAFQYSRDSGGTWQTIPRISGGLQGYEIVAKQGNYRSGHYDVIASCPVGKVVVGGGCSQITPTGPSSDGAIVSSAPAGGNPPGWYCRTRDVGAAENRITSAYAICVTP